MKRSSIEEYCKSQFDKFLARTLISFDVKWEDVCAARPDYYLFIDNVKYAVEVTSLVEQIPLGKLSPISALGVDKFLIDFVQDVERSAIKEGILYGQYVVSLTPINNFEDFLYKVKDALLAYIRKTRDVESFPPEQIFRKVILPHLQLCEISKIGLKRDKVYESLSGLPKSEGDIQADLLSLLNDRLAIKTQLLKNIPEPKILLLMDRYSHADLQDYKNCIKKVQGLESFHTIFIIEVGDNSFLLNSIDNNFAKKQFLTMTM
jgi:hypothetical protein